MRYPITEFTELERMMKSLIQTMNFKFGCEMRCSTFDHNQCQYFWERFVKEVYVISRKRNAVCTSFKKDLKMAATFDPTPWHSLSNVFYSSFSFLFFFCKITDILTESETYDQLSTRVTWLLCNLTVTLIRNPYKYAHQRTNQ